MRDLPRFADYDLSPVFNSSPVFIETSGLDSVAEKKARSIHIYAGGWRVRWRVQVLLQENTLPENGRKYDESGGNGYPKTTKRFRGETTRGNENAT